MIQRTVVQCCERDAGAIVYELVERLFVAYAPSFA
jgi:hypothetical protein